MLGLVSSRRWPVRNKLFISYILPETCMGPLWNCAPGKAEALFALQALQAAGQAP